MIKIMFLAFIIFSLAAFNAYPYDNEITHRDITRNAVENSHTNSYLINNIGVEKGIETKISGKSILQWLREGSYQEDISNCRASNHFHNPLFSWEQSAMSDQPGWLDAVCFDWKPWYSGITWATGYLAPPPSGAKETFSSYSANSPINWDKARDYYYKTLTFTLSNDREIYLSWAFEAIGHILHLLQDVSVPAHVRNDFTSHLVFSGVKSLNPTKWYIQAFEKYVQINPTLVANANPTTDDFPSFTNTRVTDFWDTDQYNGSNPSILNSIGLAEFTNANYLSDTTITSNNPTSEHTFPYPYIRSSSVSGPSYQICIDYAHDSLNKRKYVSRKTKGACPQPSTSRTADHFAVASLINAESLITSDNISNLKLWLDNNVHNTYAKELLPRSVGYSSGLLNYFFRGDLEVTSTPNGMKIKNINSETMSSYTDSAGATIGSISIYYDDTANNRHLLANYELSTPLGSGQETPVISYTPPSDNIAIGKYIIVFHGKLGNEEGAVIGKVINLKHIYYTSARSGIEKIYKMATDGSNPTVVYDNQNPDIYVRKPIVSPDGNLLSFVTFNGIYDYIGTTHLLNLTTSSISTLTTGEGFSWSPDGGKILLQRETGECLPNYADYEIFTIDITTGIQTQLTNVSGCSGSVHPAWSPNGTTIAYSRFDAPERGANCLNFNVIYLMDSSGNPIGPITCGNDVYEDFAPSWSPDGSEIVFIRNVSPQNYYQLYKVNINTGTITKLTDSNGTNFDESIPAWSPDGAAIGIGSSRDGDYDIWLVNPNGGGYNTNLTNSNQEYDIQPSFER